MHDLKQRLTPDQSGVCPDCGGPLVAVTTAAHSRRIPIYYCQRALNEAGWYSGKYGASPDSPHRKIRRFTVVAGRLVEARGYLRQAA
jgi:hypothetical protein